MNISDLTKKYGKKTIPEIRPGDTVRIHFKITEGGKSRLQVFEGLVIACKHGKSLNGTIKVRKISGGIGVERTFPIHSPLITKFEKVKHANVRRSKLYFIRDIVSKKQKNKKQGVEEYQMWEEAKSEEELAKIEEEKAKAAEEKKAKKAEKEKELKDKFEQAVASHRKIDDKISEEKENTSEENNK